MIILSVFFWGCSPEDEAPKTETAKVEGFDMRLDIGLDRAPASSQIPNPGYYMMYGMPYGQACQLPNYPMQGVPNAQQINLWGGQGIQNACGYSMVDPNLGQQVTGMAGWGLNGLMDVWDIWGDYSSGSGKSSRRKSKRDKPKPPIEVIQTVIVNPDPEPSQDQDLMRLCQERCNGGTCEMRNGMPVCVIKNDNPTNDNEDEFVVINQTTIVNIPDKTQTSQVDPDNIKIIINLEEGEDAVKACKKYCKNETCDSAKDNQYRCTPKSTKNPGVPDPADKANCDRQCDDDEACRPVFHGDVCVGYKCEYTGPKPCLGIECIPLCISPDGTCPEKNPAPDNGGGSGGGGVTPSPNPTPPGPTPNPAPAPNPNPSPAPENCPGPNCEDPAQRNSMCEPRDLSDPASEANHGECADCVTEYNKIKLLGQFENECSDNVKLFKNSPRPTSINGNDYRCMLLSQKLPVSSSANYAHKVCCGGSEKSNKRPCVDEDYTNAVYKTMSEVVQCTQSDNYQTTLKDIFANFNFESSFHVTAYNKSGVYPSVGLAQLATYMKDQGNNPGGSIGEIFKYLNGDNYLKTGLDFINNCPKYKSTFDKAKLIKVSSGNACELTDNSTNPELSAVLGVMSFRAMESYSRKFLNSNNLGNDSQCDVKDRVNSADKEYIYKRLSKAMYNWGPGNARLVLCKYLKKYPNRKLDKSAFAYDSKSFGDFWKFAESKDSGLDATNPNDDTQRKYMRNMQYSLRKVSQMNNKDQGDDLQCSNLDD